MLSKQLIFAITTYKTSFLEIPYTLEYKDSLFYQGENEVNTFLSTWTHRA